VFKRTKSKFYWLRRHRRLSMKRETAYLGVLKDFERDINNAGETVWQRWQTTTKRKTDRKERTSEASELWRAF